ncbi:MAG: methyltransferase domain-containing protein [Opitutaceae bacterium]|nr:methyltransferase domain-containing protein [Opitutaceae bacterium]
MDSSDPQFWNSRYLSGQTPWDLKRVPPALAGYLKQVGETGIVLLPGCGMGYEVRAFHDVGWQPLAIDFSPAAVARAREVLGPLAPLVRQADFFSDDIKGPFDLIYERAFLCALPPHRWPEYVARMVQLLRPGGMLAGFFYYGTDPDGPPFPIAADQATRLFASFDLREDRAIPPEQSIPLQAGYERWQEWHLRPL